MNPRASIAPHPAATRVLVIDDEVDMVANYVRLLESAGHTCAQLHSPAGLNDKLLNFQPDVVLTDMVMPGGTGIDVLKTVQAFDRGIPVIVLTAHGSIEGAVDAIKRQAADYLTKPFSVEELLGRIQALASRRLLEHAHAERPAAGGNDQAWRKDIVGVSPEIERALELAVKVARTDVNVLIVGESGTGKEVFARLIHRLSARAAEVFVPVDCASMPETLIESELFGYQKGAFTGATSAKLGLLQFAHHGTLFLDEIGDMPITLQVKLLRVLQERQFRAIGSNEQVGVDVRVLAATNADLSQAVRDKSFRSDLYYRLNVVTLRLPPLREHSEDVPLLASHFLRQFAAKNKLEGLVLDPSTIQALKAYDWPGNVRELRNAIEYAATMADGQHVTLADLPEYMGNALQLQTTVPGEAQLFGRKSELLLNFERDFLVSVLVTHGFNLSKAAEAAGCHRRTLYRMIHRQNIDLAALRREHSTRGRAENRPRTGAA